MTQTLAILLDAYRELNARKMFWISIGMSVIIVAAMACLGVTEEHFTILGFPLTGIPIKPVDLYPAGRMRELYYKGVFQVLGLDIWLTWGAMILALVSTASIIPDFISSGSIESMLAKPIGRVRFFLTKYLGSMMFVALQTTVFCGLTVLMIGARGGGWNWTIFMAVPLVTLVFSYLYSVSALVGVWLRSTLAALAITLALWLVIFGFNTADKLVIQFKVTAEDPIPVMRTHAEATRLQISKLEQSADPADQDPARLTRLKNTLEKQEKDLAERVDEAASINKYYRWAYTVKTILPKTSETSDLLQRVLVSKGQFEEMGAKRDTVDFGGSNRRDAFAPSNGRIEHLIQAILRNRSIWWIIGTSLGFEAVMLFLACRIFAKRDF